MRHGQHVGRRTNTGTRGWRAALVTPDLRSRKQPRARPLDQVGGHGVGTFTREVPVAAEPFLRLLDRVAVGVTLDVEPVAGKPRPQHGRHVAQHLVSRVLQRDAARVERHRVVDPDADAAAAVRHRRLAPDLVLDLVDDVRILVATGGRVLWRGELTALQLLVLVAQPRDIAAQFADPLIALAQHVLVAGGTASGQRDDASEKNEDGLADHGASLTERVGMM